MNTGYKSVKYQSIKALAHPDVMYFSSLWMMILLVIGTFAEKYVGLYLAQKNVFLSWIMWWGYVPMPGGLMTMAVIGLSLLVKTLVASEWSLRRSGVILVHIGALLLLGGGVVTSLSSQEGNMVVYEGQTVGAIADYNDREFVVFRSEGGGETVLLSQPFEDLSIGKTIHIPRSSIVVDVVKLCRNCAVFDRKDSPDAYKGMAARLDIAPTALEKQDEINKAGIQFRVSGADEAENGIYFSMDFIETKPTIRSGENSYTLALRKKQTDLPFTLTLEKFDKTFYPATDIAKSYRSDVVVHDGTTSWRSVIEMNQPLRYRGYTFFQSSFIDDAERPATVLAVVKNSGRMFPYISCGVIGLGLLVHMLLMVPRLFKKRGTAKFCCVLLAVGILLLPSSLQANEPSQTAAFDLTAFARIPLLDQGRVKPMSSFAESALHHVHGGQSVEGLSSLAWLAEVLVNPDRAYDRFVFKIRDTRVRDTLKLPERKTSSYSFREVAAGIENSLPNWRDALVKNQDQRNDLEKSLVDIYDKAQTFGALSRSLSIVFPDFVIEDHDAASALGLVAGQSYSFDELMRHKDSVSRVGQRVLEKISKKGRAESYVFGKHADAQVVRLVRLMQSMDADRQSQMFRVIPSSWGAGNINSDDRAWVAPWDVSNSGQGSPEARKLMNGWGDLVKAYRQQEPSVWAKAAELVRAQTVQMAVQSINSNTVFDQRKLELENAYNQLKPLNTSMLVYGVALLSLLLTFGGRVTMAWDRGCYAVGCFFLVSAVVCHALGLLMRMVIMGRPPVTNLYASIVFVALAATLGALYYEWRYRNRIGLFVGSVAGSVLLWVGLKFSGEGDHLGVVVAVLDTNFWLSTHVVCMTLGYAVCIVAALMAHGWLVMRALDGWSLDKLSQLSANIRGTAYIALFFNVVGTILGGIWADQSWGRFWGWDPKENGALLIVLWLLFLTHGRLGGRLREIGFNAGMALTTIIVALAWFGVNLLGVGLHSYGFTEGAMAGLVSFMLLEVGLVGCFVLAIRTRRKKLSHE